MAGLWFEEFEVGQVFRHEVRRTVTDMDNILFSSLTYNPAALHIDHAYAATTEFGKPLMNSLFTLGLVIGLSVLDTTFGTTVANLGMSETTFPKPVFAGDTTTSRPKCSKFGRASRGPIRASSPSSTSASTSATRWSAARCGGR